MQNPLEATLKEWEDARGALGKQSGRLDATAKSQFNDLNAKTNAIHKAYGDNRVSRDEYLQAVADIKSSAEEFRWQSHTLDEGSVQGDIVEVKGVQKLRDQNGLTPIGYTSDYITKNSVPIGDTGQYAVPVGPGKPYSLVRKEVTPRDAAEERAGIDEIRKAIAKQYEDLVSQEMGERRILDSMGNVIGNRPMSQDDIYRLAATAGQTTWNRYSQAKAVWKSLMDKGIDDPSQIAVRGEATEPFLDATAPVPTQSPMPQMQQMPQYPVAGPQMVAGSRQRPVRVSSKEEFAQLAGAPDGTMAELPDGKLYQMEGGRFMQLAGNVPMQRGPSGMLTYAGMPEEEQLAMMQGQAAQTTPQLAPEEPLQLTESMQLELMRQQGQMDRQQAGSFATNIRALVIQRNKDSELIGHPMTKKEFQALLGLAEDMANMGYGSDGGAGGAMGASLPDASIDEQIAQQQDEENRRSFQEGRRPVNMHQKYAEERAAGAGPAVGMGGPQQPPPPPGVLGSVRGPVPPPIPQPPQAMTPPVTPEQLAAAEALMGGGERPSAAGMVKAAGARARKVGRMTADEQEFDAFKQRVNNWQQDAPLQIASSRASVVTRGTDKSKIKIGQAIVMPNGKRYINTKWGFIELPE